MARWRSRFGQPGKQYLVSAASSLGTSLSLWSVTNPTSTPIVAGEATIPVGAYGAPPNATQLAGGTLIYTGDTRLLNAVYRDGSLYTAHTVSCNLGFYCARAIVIDVSGFSARTFTVGLSGFYYYYPAVMPDSLGSDAAVGVALANPNNATTTVTLKLIDQNGTILATDSLTLVAFGQTAFVPSDRQAFRNALLTPAEFVGSLAVTTLNPARLSALWLSAPWATLYSPCP